MNKEEQVQFTWIQKNLIIYVAWVFMWVLVMHMSISAYTSLWFPSMAISFVGILIWGIAITPAILLAVITTGFFAGFVFLGKYNSDMFLYSTLPFALSHVLGYLLGVSIFRRMLTKTIHSSTNAARTWLLYFYLFSFVTAYSTSVIDTAGHMFDGMSFVRVLQFSAKWFVSEWVGILVLGPIILHLASIFIPDIKGSIFPKIHQSFTFDKGVLAAKLGLLVFTLIVVLYINYRFNNLLAALLMGLVAIPHLYICRTEPLVLAPILLGTLVFIAVLFIDSFGLKTYAYVFQIYFIILAIATWTIVSLRLTRHHT